jgi:hypothetical protein
MENDNFELDFTKLSESRLNKSTGKRETVLVHDIRCLAGVGKDITYHKGRNEYFPGKGGKALKGDALEKALAGVRWDFSELSGTKDSFPPSPENIELKRKELFAELTAGGRMPTAEQIAAVYEKTSPTRIDPISTQAKALHDRLSNPENVVIQQFLKGQ